jgi:FixJ family two-component response regulator
MQVDLGGDARLAENDPKSMVRRLTRTQRAILSGLLCGDSGKSIAAALRMDPADYETQRTALMTQLNADSTAEAVRIALLAGMDDPRHRTSRD